MKNRMILVFLFSLLCVSCHGGGGSDTQSVNVMSSFNGTYTVAGGDITYGENDPDREDM